MTQAQRSRERLRRHYEVEKALADCLRRTTSREDRAKLYETMYDTLFAAVPDHPRLTAQLLGLERRTGRSGRDIIDHQPGGHDDLINAAAGALVRAMQSAAGPVAPLEPTPDELDQLGKAPVRPNGHGHKQRSAIRHDAGRASRGSGTQSVRFNLTAPT